MKYADLKRFRQCIAPINGTRTDAQPGGEVVDGEEKSEPRAASPAARFAGDCPCDDPSLCASLSPQPPPRDEVVAFTSRSQSHGNGTEWAYYDWDKITTLSPFETQGNRAVLQKMYCEAHKHGARVLHWSEPSVFGNSTGGCPTPTFYSWGLHNDSRLYNTTAVAAWAAETAACVVREGFDGVLLDMERTGGPSRSRRRTLFSDRSERAALHTATAPDRDPHSCAVLCDAIARQGTRARPAPRSAARSRKEFARCAPRSTRRCPAPWSRGRPPVKDSSAN